MGKLFYIKERINPQFANSYYVAKGQMTKKDTKEMLKPGYGTNYVHSFETKADYDAEIAKLIADGYRVHGVINE